MFPSQRIIAAIDTPHVPEAIRLAEQLIPHLGGLKLGLEFLSANGPQGVREVQAAAPGRLFLDTKFSDIPNTVAGAVRSICALQPWMLNVHTMAGAAAMRAAADAAGHAAGGGTRPLVIGVTVLTSLDAEQLERIGVPGGVEPAVVRLALLAQESGLDGVVASPLEVAAIRAACGPGFVIVTPGVRPAGTRPHDQVRVASPEAALAAGADYLVIGRAITGADDPGAAAAAIVAGLAAH